MPVTTHPDDAELSALRASIDARLPAFLVDLERLVNVDCGSYTPAGVDEIGRWAGAFLEGIGADVEYRADPAGRHGSTVVGVLNGRARGPRGGRKSRASAAVSLPQSGKTGCQPRGPSRASR